jgi:hypothetical protein
MVGAMAYPALQVPFQMQTLRKAGELVRVQWCKARLKAMRTGQIQMFTFEPETGTYRVEPYITQQDLVDADAHRSGSVSAGVSGAAPASLQQSQPVEAQSRELPEGVVFASIEVQPDSRSLQLEQQERGTMSGMVNSSGGTPIAPLLFYPDGTTSDAKIALTNQYQRLYAVVSVRGLTGVVKVSELVSSDELQQVP